MDIFLLLSPLLGFLLTTCFRYILIATASCCTEVDPSPTPVPESISQLGAVDEELEGYHHHR